MLVKSKLAAGPRANNIILLPGIMHCIMNGIKALCTIYSTFADIGNELNIKKLDAGKNYKFGILFLEMFLVSLFKHPKKQILMKNDIIKNIHDRASSLLKLRLLCEASPDHTWIHIIDELVRLYSLFLNGGCIMYARYIKYLDVEIRPKIIELEADSFRIPTWYPSQGGHPEEHDRAQEEFVRHEKSQMKLTGNVYNAERVERVSAFTEARAVSVFEIVKISGW